MAVNLCMSFFCYLDLPSDPSFLHVCATSVVSFIELLLPLYDILRLYRRHFRDPIRDRRTFSFSFLQVKCLLIQILNRHFGLRYSVKYSMTEEDTIKQGSPSFLDKLYTILEEESPHIISWNGEGETFIIFSPELFSQKVMSKYFKSTKFNSFVRQLNFYGFKKTTRDPSSDDKSLSSRFWEFRHPQFLRGRRDLLCKIHRKQIGDGDIDTESRFRELEREVQYLYQIVSELSHWKVRTPIW